MARNPAARRPRRRQCTAARHTLPALAAVVLPAGTDQDRAGAILTAAINANPQWPMTAEVVEAPTAADQLVSQERLRSRKLVGYVLVLQVSNAPGRPSESKLLRVAGKAAGKALRKAYGRHAACSVQSASDPRALDLCWHSIIGRPRFDIP